MISSEIKNMSHFLTREREEIIKGYESATKFAKKHYENFPVISFLIPQKLQKHIAIIYWFARTADDIADEGNETEEVRLTKLADFQRRLDELLKGNFENEYEAALANTITEMNLSPEHFYNLLKAFKQDISKKRYNNFEELLLYCKHSANPVGRLILELFNIRDEKAFTYSDNICTALQLTNFYQDVKIDYEKGRIYFPVDELEKFSVPEKSFEEKKYSDNFRKLIEYNIIRTEALFAEGRKLLPFLTGRLRYEINWTILGGEAILNKIKRINYNVLYERPLLSKKDYMILFLKSLMK